MSGIRAQSRPGKYVIFCVGQDPKRIEEFIEWAHERAIPIKELAGQYKGQDERSFITPQSEYEKVEHWTIEEESVLVLGESDGHGARSATLIFAGHETPIGRFRECDKSMVKLFDSWTLDPTTGTYYVCS